MGKGKILSVMVIALLTSMTAGAVELEGNIKVEVTTISGVVNLDLNVTTSQNVDVNVDVEGQGENKIYHVNDTLAIDLDVTDNSGRIKMFMFPRSIIYSVGVIRDFTNVPILPIFSYADRLMPVSLFDSVNVVDSMFAEKDDNISIKLDYIISNAIFSKGKENLTLIFSAIGMLPGKVSGSSVIPTLVSPIHGIELVHLKVTYII